MDHEDPTRRATVLLVDGDARQRRSLAGSLHAVVDRVIEAESPELALGECSVHAVDLVATSAQLPGMGACALRSELVGRGGPPIVAYGEGDVDRRVRWLDAGGADCVPTIDGRTLAARCSAILRRCGPGAR